jgi:hypothetical protein
MQHLKDFIYEYSDLNVLHTRVKLLTGVYAGLIFEYGGSMLAISNEENTFTFEYTLYEVPIGYDAVALRKDPAFNEYIAYAIIAVITARRNDKDELENLHEAASVDGVQNSKIKINACFYHTVSQPVSSLEIF